MKNSNLENTDIKEKVRRGLDLTFEKLIKAKKQTNGIIVMSKDGMIKKIKASDFSK